MINRVKLFKILDGLKAEMETDPTRRFVVKTRISETSEWIALRDASGQRPMLYTLAVAKDTVEAFRKLNVEARFVGVGSLNS